MSRDPSDHAELSDSASVVVRRGVSVCVLGRAGSTAASSEREDVRDAPDASRERVAPDMLDGMRARASGSGIGNACSGVRSVRSAGAPSGVMNGAWSESSSDAALLLLRSIAAVGMDGCRNFV